jgi:hypothetical protein
MGHPSEPRSGHGLDADDRRRREAKEAREDVSVGAQAPSVEILQPTRLPELFVKITPSLGGLLGHVKSPKAITSRQNENLPSVAGPPTERRQTSRADVGHCLGPEEQVNVDKHEAVLGPTWNVVTLGIAIKRLKATLHAREFDELELGGRNGDLPNLSSSFASLEL